MKKIFAVFAIIVLIFTACEDETEVTQLTVKNESSAKISSITWNNNNIYHGQYDIGAGQSKTQNVQPGTGYIFFQKTRTNPVNGQYYVDARTSDVVVVDADEQITFTFTDNTVVVDIETNTTGTLGSL